MFFGLMCAEGRGDALRGEAESLTSLDANASMAKRLSLYADTLGAAAYTNL